jgi:serine/threonine protein kinase/tetratricopeptide (TPR) repeat protein
MTEEELFEAARHICDEAARAVFLDRACAGSTALRRRVEALLRSHYQAGGFLELPAADLDATSDEIPGRWTDPGDLACSSEKPGGRIGPYKLLQALGEGGMGAVFLAEQEHPVKRRVALKVVKAGMDSARVIARFEQERQALALMDHPNIAKVLDAGTTDSRRPFFVMELVKGIPITRFCDQECLAPKERLELFLPVCQAVQHAHTKGIIHRDLKPSNVLIALYDGRPVVKVIDFGVAKAIGQKLTGQTLFTEVGQIVGTLEYMAPEQAELNNLDIDTRADIYSLGVLLYELLTGSPPFTAKQLRSAALSEVLRLIREVEPARPSTKLSSSAELPAIAAKRKLEPAKLAKLVRGELDWIVMKCLEKERGRRYETANSLALDIQRYLADEPVLAGPPRASYRLRKLVRKHRGPVVAAGCILLLLVAGIVGTSLGFVRAERLRELAEANAKTALEEKAKAVAAADAERVAKQNEAAERKNAEVAQRRAMIALQATTDDVTEQLIGARAALGPLEKAFLEKTLERWQTFAAEKGDSEQARYIRAEGTFRVARLRTKLGDRKEGLAGLRKSLVLIEQLAVDYPAVPAYRQAWAMTYDAVGYILQEQGKHGEAEAAYRQALTILKKLAADFPAMPEYRLLLARCHNQLGILLSGMNRRKEAEDEYRKALELHQKLVADLPADPQYRQALGFTHNVLGVLQHEMGKSVEAEAALRQALALQEPLAAELPDRPRYRRELAMCEHDLGTVLSHLSKQTEAEAAFRKAVKIQEELAAELPAFPEYRNGLTSSLNSLGILLSEQGKTAEAKAIHLRALGLRAKLAAEFPSVPEYRHLLASSHTNLGSLLDAMGKGTEAVAAYRQAVDQLDKLATEVPRTPQYRDALAATLTSLGSVLGQAGSSAEAEAACRRALSIRARLVADFPDEPEYRYQLAACQHNLGLILRSLGKVKEAEAASRQTLTVQEELVVRFPAVAKHRDSLALIWFNLAETLRLLGNRAEAEAADQRALSIMATLARDFPSTPKYRHDLAKIHGHLGFLFRELHRPAQAEAAYRQALALEEKLVAEFPAVPAYRQVLAGSYQNMGKLLREMGKLAEAEAALRKAVTVREQLIARDPAVAGYRHDLAWSHQDLGLLLVSMGKRAEGEAAYRRAIRLWAKLATDLPGRPEYAQALAGSHNALGMLLGEVGKHAAAEEAYRQALRIQDKLIESSPRVAEYRFNLSAVQGNLGRLCLARRQPEQALEWHSKAIANLESMLKERADAMARHSLSRAYDSRARAFVEMKHYSRAAADFTKAVELAPAPERTLVCLRRVQNQVRTGQVEASLKEAEELARNANARELYDAACVFALAAERRKETDGSLSKEDCARRAVALLRRAVDRGYWDAKHMKEDEDLRALRERKDFKELLAEVEKKAP